MGKKLGEMASGLKVHLTATAGLEQLEFETSEIGRASCRERV